MAVLVTIPRHAAAMLAIVAVCATVRAQHPPLAPTADTTIVVSSGVLHYSSILIPNGVTVRFVAPLFGPSSIPGMPAVIQCDGDAIVHGTISLAGDQINDRPAGWVTTGVGTVGFQCAAAGINVPAGGGRHDFGSVTPFSLEGGSLGGYNQSYQGLSCNQLLWAAEGGDGGGTLVLLAGGRIEIHGTVTANGQGTFAGGSGGSILLRGDAGVRVFPGATVTARGGTAWNPPFPPWPLTFSDGQDGKIRLDAWGAPPQIQGTVSPPPTLLELPFLRALSPPTLGTTWTLQVFAPDTGWVYVAASLAPGNTPTQFGPVGIDLASSAAIAIANPTASHDPFLTVQWPIPNSPTLIGFAMWLQSIAVPPSLAPRVSNTIAVVVQ